MRVTNKIVAKKIVAKKVKNVLLPVMALGLTVALPGCGSLFGQDGYFRDRGDDYLRAEPMAPLRVPAAASENIGQLFVIPPIAEPDAPLPERFEVPRPTGGELVAGQRNEVKIQKLAERRWITVNAAPGAVWPRVRSFLDTRGLSLSVLDPVMGVLETGWLSIKDDPSSKDRYRIRLEQGLRSGVTELHVLQMTVPQVVPGSGQVNWPSRSVNPEREAWMINELAAYLAQEDTAQASMLAQAIGNNDRKVKLVSAAETGEAHLLLQVDYARAWASTSGALSRNGFAIESSQRESGEWLASYSSERAQAGAVAQQQEDDDGIFTRMARAFGFGDDGKPADVSRYKLQLKDGDAGAMLTVRNENGEPLPARETDKLLRMIQANLL